MSTIRQNKIARLLQRELSQILAREIDGLQGAMITLSHMTVTPDISIARAYITVLPEDRLKSILVFLNEESHAVRRLLAQRLRNNMRTVPEVEFYEDDTLRVANRLEALFKELHEKEGGKPSDDKTAGERADEE